MNRNPDFVQNPSERIMVMQDVFIEYMVTRGRTPKTTLLKLGAAVGGGVLAIIFFLLSPILGAISFLGLLLAFGSLYGAYLIITSMNVEFEYSLTNGELDVDKIIAQRKRRRLATIKCRDIEDFGRYKASEHANKSYPNKIFACDYDNGDDLWYFVFKSRDKGKTLLVLNSNEKMIEGIKPFIPRPIFHREFNART